MLQVLLSMRVGEDLLRMLVVAVEQGGDRTGRPLSLHNVLGGAVALMHALMWKC